MDDLMAVVQKNGRGGEDRHREMKGEVGRLESEVQEVKVTGARALVQSNEVQADIRHLRDRVSNLENNSASPGTSEAAASGGDPWTKFRSNKAAYSDTGRPGAPLAGTTAPRHLPHHSTVLQKPELSYWEDQRGENGLGAGRFPRMVQKEADRGLGKEDSAASFASRDPRQRGNCVCSRTSGTDNHH